MGTHMCIQQQQQQQELSRHPLLLRRPWSWVYLVRPLLRRQRRRRRGSRHNSRTISNSNSFEARACPSHHSLLLAAQEEEEEVVVDQPAVPPVRCLPTAMLVRATDACRTRLARPNVRPKEAR
jgi:hypothetical protein